MTLFLDRHICLSPVDTTVCVIEMSVYWQIPKQIVVIFYLLKTCLFINDTYTDSCDCFYKIDMSV